MGLFSIFRQANTLYFPGCAVYFKDREKFEFYQKVFSRLGIDFKLSDKQVCCGLPALEAGYEQEARKLARRNFEIFKEQGIKEIITNSPCCFKMFLKDYPDILPDWDIEVRDLWQMISDKLERKPRLIKRKFNEAVTYHDSCYLGRYCEVYGAPRRILELIGFTLNEMEDSREMSTCCGSCGGLSRIAPELADKIARQRLLQAKRTSVKKIITASFDNYQLMKKNSEGVGIEVLDLLEVLGFALGIETEKFEEEVSKEEQVILDIKADERIKGELKEEFVEEEMNG